jgi:hypothetical protein
MAVDVRNVVVGAANLFISASAGASRPGYNGASNEWGASASAITGSASESAAKTLRADTTNWREAGLTTEGLEVSYEPNYGEVTVDQLLDVAKIFKQSLRVTMKTSLTEATLQNMELAFGQQNVNSFTASSTTLSLAAGALGAEPIERALIAVSQSAPEGAVWGTGGSASPTSTQFTERIYLARRVVSMDTVSHGLKRDSATVFPVTFRCLPDTGWNGSEYGKILDRIYTTQYTAI